MSLEIFETTEIVKIAQRVLKGRTREVWNLTWVDKKTNAQIQGELGIGERLVRMERSEANRQMDRACKNVRFCLNDTGTTIRHSHRPHWSPDKTAQGKLPTEQSNYPVHMMKEDWWRFK